MSKVVDTDLYAMLGVAPSATSDEITAAFRAYAKESHPDRHGGDPLVAEHFKAVTNAYDVLIRPARRAAYDRRRGTHPPGRPSPTGTRHQPIFKTERSARVALWSGVALVLFGLAGTALLGSIDTGDAPKTITLWLVVTKLIVCGAILWGAGVWRLRHPERAVSVTPQ